MDAKLVMQMISSVGFPIFMCVWMMRNQEKTIEALNQNTQAMNSIKDAVDDLKRSDRNV